MKVFFLNDLTMYMLHYFLCLRNLLLIEKILLKFDQITQVERIGKFKSSASNNGIMASVWKFHKDDHQDEECLNDKTDLI